MTQVLVFHFGRLEVERLDISRPIFSSYDDWKFKPLYEAIGQSTLAYFRLAEMYRRMPNGRIVRSDAPLKGIESLRTSKIKSFDYKDWGESNAKLVSFLAQALPESVVYLYVIKC